MKTMMNIFYVIATSIFLLAPSSEGFTVSGEQSPKSSSSSSQLFYTNDGMTLTKPTTTTAEPIIKGKKPYITKLSSLDELKYFVQEDDRMVAIKFYAPWCKTCQRLGMQFTRLATELGDGIASRKMVEGQVRFAEVAYSPQTNHFIQDQLQVAAVPTLQLYHGVNKLWQRSGTKDTRDLRNEVLKLKSKSKEELLILGEEQDDGILQYAIEDTMYDAPDFLLEEW
ncbi:unnamed protein product [Cylindrotheca closterium]|uniref:Thioredoxin domain-containing protein n=1 Tax=Cylindrotheca closterium TaxID=2856 RepID=A0AAD2JLB1_9STRA|nr:unnamed protein product [Cylindrotheca closterium]